jgi:FkbM family methyltransferase
MLENIYIYAKTLIKIFAKKKYPISNGIENNQFSVRAENYEVTELDRTFCILPQSNRDLWRAKSFGIKEPETNKWLRMEIDELSVFWDIGANIGLFSLYAASLNNKCKILAFEPESQNFSSLCQNVFVNCFENIDVNGFAVCGSISHSIQDLYVSEMGAGSAVQNLGVTSPWYSKQAVFRQKTFAVSPDELVAKFGFPAPTIMKIDVDGIELEILKGSRQILHGNIRTLLIELDADDDKEVKEMKSIMSNAGFFLLLESDRNLRLNGKLPRNYIWKKN